MNTTFKSARTLVLVGSLAVLTACAGMETPPQTANTAVSPTPMQIPGAGWYQVMFDTAHSDINASGQVVVRSVATALQRDPNLRVTVIGKTDRVGTEAANAALSEKRAGRVRDALIATGMVQSSRIEVRWLGEGRQDVLTADDVAEQRNRVVDITVQ